MSILPRLSLALALAAAVPLFAACGGDGEAVASDASAEVAPPDPFSLAELPAESIYGVSPAVNVWTPRFEIGIRDLPAGWDGARIAVLSDFQLGLWPENAEVAARAVQLAVEAEPDLVVLLGDYIAEGDAYGELSTILEPLRGQRLIAVLGDRDLRTDSTEVRAVRMLTNLGAVVLRNSVAQLGRNGSVLRVGGLDPDLLASPIGEQQWVVGTLGAPAAVPLLLTHAPGLGARAPGGRFGLILSGHTFCGDVEVPGTPRLSWLANEVLAGSGVDASEQLFQVEDAALLVTCGLGYAFVPLRYGAAPEVPIVILSHVGDAPADEAADSLSADTVAEAP